MKTIKSVVSRSLVLILTGFAGGFLSLVFTAWFKPMWLKETLTAADGLAMANTYIVFTSFIFVAFTVFLAVAGFLFSQQFAQSRESHVTEALEHIKVQISENGQWSTSLVNAILDSPDGKRHVQTMLDSKISELINQRSQDLNSRAEVASALASPERSGNHNQGPRKWWADAPQGDSPDQNNKRP